MLPAVASTFLPMKKFSLYILCLILLTGCLSSEGTEFGFAAPDNNKMCADSLAKIDAVIESGIDKGQFPGAVVSVVKDDKIVYYKAFGNRQTVPEAKPMTVETLFDLASLSKCVATAPAVLQLVEEDLISLNDKVSDYLPGFLPWEDAVSGKVVDITIQDLLTHSSGLDPEIVVSDYINRYGSPLKDSLAAYISTEVKRNFEPKTDGLYSCVNFLTLQLILEKVTGVTLREYVGTHLFHILGMEHSEYCPEGNLLENCAPTEVQGDGMPLLGVVHDPTARVINRGVSGNAGVFSTAYDLSLFAAALMNGGEINGKRFLSNESVQNMIQVPSDNAVDVGRALGWDKYSSSSKIKGSGFSENTICHTGYTGTSMVIDMDSKVAVILLTNRVHPEDKGSITSLRAAISTIVANSIVE